MLPIFQWIYNEASVTKEEMLQNLNCGIGMILAVGADDVDKVKKILQSENCATPAVLGAVKAQLTRCETVAFTGNFNVSKSY